MQCAYSDLSIFGATSCIKALIYLSVHQVHVSLLSFQLDNDASVECHELETDDDQENNYADNVIPNFLSLDHSRLDTFLQLSNDVRVRDILVLTLALSVRHSWTYENIVHL